MMSPAGHVLRDEDDEAALYQHNAEQQHQARANAHGRNESNGIGGNSFVVRDAKQHPTSGFKQQAAPKHTPLLNNNNNGYQSEGVGSMRKTTPVVRG